MGDFAAYLYGIVRRTSPRCVRVRWVHAGGVRRVGSSALGRETGGVIAPGLEFGSWGQDGANGWTRCSNPSERG